MKLTWTYLLILCLPLSGFAKERIVNVYAYTDEIPDYVVQQFEKETGIKVNISTYENNEIMYAKLRASKQPGYDVIMPSSYFVDRMRQQNLLLKLDKSKLPNAQNINPEFLNPIYDPQSEYSVPHIWGVTGIFYNSKYYNGQNIKRWSDLWDERFDNKLMLLDDSREVFSMSLLSLGYSANDSDPEHLQLAFQKLQLLMKNVKVFSAEMVVSIMIDEDATIGMAWNGDAYKASLENPNVKFVFPLDGFVIWVDNFSIPTTAPHQNTAYTFVNFMLRADIAKEIALYTHFPTPNLAAQKLLPADIANNTTVFPPQEVLHRGQFQTNLSDTTLALYDKYWQQLKMGG